MNIESIFNLPIVKVEIGTLDYIMFHFGSMIDALNIRRNKIISRGEYLLAISDCAWRIKEGGKIIFSSRDSYNDELMDEVSCYLQGKKVISYTDISKSDFEITFNNNSVFQSFFFVADVDEPVKWGLYDPEGESLYCSVN